MSPFQQFNATDQQKIWGSHTIAAEYSILLWCDNESLNKKFPPFHRTAIPSKVTNCSPNDIASHPTGPESSSKFKLVDFCISPCNNLCDTQLERTDNQISNVLWFSSSDKIQSLQDNFCQKFLNSGNFSPLLFQTLPYTALKKWHTYVQTWYPKMLHFSCKLVQGGVWAVLTWHGMSPRENNFVN